MPKQKALCVATRCTTAQQFIETFHRFCDEQSFFVATMNMREVGLETPFSIQLADKTPVLRGLCVVLAAFTTPANAYKRPGIRLGIRRLTPESEDVFYQLQAMRTAAPQEISTEASDAVSETPVPVKLPPTPTAPRVSPPALRTRTPRAGAVVNVPAKATPAEPIAVVPPPPPTTPRPTPTPTPTLTTPPVPPKAEEQRTPGSAFVLPANPLMNLTDESLVGFVDCTIYEETANFFRVDGGDFEDDELAPPPPPASRPRPPSFLDDDVLSREESTSHAVAAVEALEPPPLPSPPSPPVEMRVAQPVVLSSDTLDSSRPIDEPARATPMPAGEAYARQVNKARAKSRSKWFVVGGAVLAAALAVILVVVKTSSPEAANPTPKVIDKPQVVAATEPPAKVEPDISDAPKIEANDQLPANDNTPSDKPTSSDTSPSDTSPSDDSPSTPVHGEGPCRLEVTTTPAGTMVQVDGATIGPSPITLAGPCTKRRVDLVHPRYKAEQRWVTLAADKPGALDVTLARPTHTLTVTSNPAGATVFIAGRRAGTTPTKLSLMGYSSIEVKVEKPGYEPVKTRVYSKVPEDKLSVPLKRTFRLK